MYITANCIWQRIVESAKGAARQATGTYTVRDTENLPFSADTPHRFSEGSRAAIRGRPCGNSRIVSAAMRGRSEDLEEVRG